MATTTAAEEDFSFQITATGSPPEFIESPPLWRCFSTSTTIASPQENLENSKGKEVQNEEEDEDKMDMLWEDLNDEFSRIGCGSKAQIRSDVSSPGREVKISCVKALKLSKANRNMFDGKKPSILVFIKVLKKVFVVQNSHRTIKKHAR
ncbi:hypothetical protein ACP275_03G116700 [Erythranthe tilingii]